MIAGRLQVPPTAKKGEAFTIRVLVQHPMETGFRREADGSDTAERERARRTIDTAQILGVSK